MIPQGLFTQLGMIIVAVAIAFTYIRPTFSTITDTQDKISTLREEKAKVTAVNQLLQQNVSTIDAISANDRKRLDTYLPQSVDTIALQRDLLAIAENTGLILTQLSAEQGEVVAPTIDPVTGQTIVESALLPAMASLGFVTDYDTLKRFLSTLERNHYPLHVQTLTIGGDTPGATDDGSVTTPSGFLTVEMELVTYGFSMNTIEL